MLNQNIILSRLTSVVPTEDIHTCTGKNVSFLAELAARCRIWSGYNNSDTSDLGRILDKILFIEVVLESQRPENSTQLIVHIKIKYIYRIVVQCTNM